MGQALVVPGDPESNFERASDMVRQAADTSCDVVVLPECGDLGWTSAAAQMVTEEHFSATTDRYRRLAAACHVGIVAGLTERSGDRVYNTAIVVDADGRVRGRHRKINELPFARRVYATGARLEAIDAFRTTIGASVCADNSESSIFIPEALCAMGARIILSPSAWAVPPGFDHEANPYGDEWKRAYTAIAARHGVPVVGVSNVGPVLDGDWAGWQCIGCSLAVDRKGRVARQLGYGSDACEFGYVDLSTGNPDTGPSPVVEDV